MSTCYVGFIDVSCLFTWCHVSKKLMLTDSTRVTLWSWKLQTSSSTHQATWQHHLSPHQPGTILLGTYLYSLGWKSVLYGLWGGHVLYSLVKACFIQSGEGMFCTVWWRNVLYKSGEGMFFTVYGEYMFYTVRWRHVLYSVWWKPVLYSLVNADVLKINLSFVMKCDDSVLSMRRCVFV